METSYPGWRYRCLPHSIQGSFVIVLPIGPIPVAVGSKAWVCGRSFAGNTGRKPRRAWVSLCNECFVLSGRGLCDGPITRPEESYRKCCVWVWSRNLNNEETLANWGLSSHENKCQIGHDLLISYTFQFITQWKHQHVMIWEYNRRYWKRRRWMNE